MYGLEGLEDQSGVVLLISINITIGTYCLILFFTTVKLFRKKNVRTGYL